MSSHLGFSTSITDLAQEYAPSVSGKTILITGVTAKSIGAAFVLGIAAASPKLIILAGRTKAKVEQTGKDLESAFPNINWRFLELNLADQDQIRQAAGEVVKYEENIDVLVLNAGVMSTPWSTTKQGIEMQFGVNHVGHFLFANLIIPKMLKGPAPRVVLTTSDGYRLGPIRFYDHNFDNGKTYNSWYAYGQSKTANMLYARSLAAKLSPKHPNFLVFSHHPGVINTELMQHMNENDFPALLAMDRAQGWSMYWGDDFPAAFFKTHEQGAATMFAAAFCGEDAGITKAGSGGYLMDCQIVDEDKVSCWGRDEIEAERLWKLTEGLVGEEFAFGGISV